MSDRFLEAIRDGCNTSLLLAARYNEPQASVVATLQAMEKAGLITRSPFAERYTVHEADDPGMTGDSDRDLDVLDHALGQVADLPPPPQLPAKTTLTPHEKRLLSLREQIAATDTAIAAATDHRDAIEQRRAREEEIAALELELQERQEILMEINDEIEELKAAEGGE